MPTDPDQVRQMLKAENFGDRIKAINQLRDLDPALAFELIQPLCDDPNTRVRYAAVSQISTLGEQDKPTALKVLTASLGDPEPDVQAAAADALGALKLTESLDDLKELYGMTREWLVQMSIVASLGEMGGATDDSRAFDLLKSALSSDNSLVRVSAIGALGELQDDRAIALLLPYVGSQDWQERHRVAQALGHFASTEKSTHSEAHQALQKLAQDESDLVAETAKSHLANR
ncbi:MAG: phycocyanin alpha phycocyanobilin lyase [Leptolyngbya foveolarum]|uniref:Phycocyanin alpha phycocyanobilin lyase n=1 Tax=Leptolyngbya foveolarum TaxID=47253 RepID=A0A2W4U2G8_9CYAN|nr:MAG: phycocyanin alpha phycocyanobilin lyase [Leptolyngbya foveolarum]